MSKWQRKGVSAPPQGFPPKEARVGPGGEVQHTRPWPSVETFTRSTEDGRRLEAIVAGDGRQGALYMVQVRVYALHADGTDNLSGDTRWPSFVELQEVVNLFTLRGALFLAPPFLSAGEDATQATPVGWGSTVLQQQGAAQGTPAYTRMMLASGGLVT